MAFTYMRSHYTPSMLGIGFYLNADFEQKIVPSLPISIGGPPVSGRLILAISLPPFQVALSSTWASVG